MILGNGNYNKLYLNSSKSYSNNASNIDVKSKNDSLSYIVNAVGSESKVLDIGCSFGYIGEWLVTNKKCTVYGGDIDEKAIEQVNKNGYYKKAIKVDIDSYYESKILLQESKFEEFDYILCADVLEHLKNPTDALKLLGECLNYGGQLLVSIPNISNLDIILNLIEERFNYDELGLLDNTHLRFFTRKSFFEWIYCSNSYFKDFIFDVNYLGYTINNQAQRDMQSRYPYLMDFILDMNPNIAAFQNIFILTKLSTTSTPYSLRNELQNYRSKEIKEDINLVNSKPSQKITISNPFNYEFVIAKPNFKGIEVLMATYNKDLKYSIAFTLYYGENFEHVLIKDIDGISLKDNNWYRVDFDIKNDRSCKAKLIISTKVDIGDFSIWQNEEDIPCIRCIYNNNDFTLEDSVENDVIWRKMNNRLKKCYTKNNQRLVEEKYNYKHEEQFNLHDYYLLKEENEKLKYLIKDLIKEIY